MKIKQSDLLSEQAESFNLDQLAWLISKQDLPL
jgi:hypothetical protein